MKKFLIILSVILVIIIGALIALPRLFMEDIKTAIHTEISKNVNAKVYFDADKAGITFFKNFPNITLTLKEFGVIGVDTFKDDTLAAVEAFDLTVDIKSLISGDQIQLKSINLINPRIFVLVQKDGSASYDIMIEKDDVSDGVALAGEEGNLSVSIDSWSIKNGKLVYYDYSSNFLMALDGINHSGSGDFSMEVFDVSTSTTIERMMASYEDVEYLKNKKLIANIVLNVDLTNQKYTFRENVFSINDFNFGFEGLFEMLSDQYNIDIAFNGNNNSVKSILSLIPGAYTEGFKDIKADGLLDFKGYVKGIYNESQNKKPAFNIQMSAENGSIKYPDLPESIKNIRFKLDVESKTGEVKNTVIDLAQLHMDLGNNPVDATLKIKDLVTYEVDASVKAYLDLEDILKLYPLDGDTDLSGNVFTDLKINGVYDTVSNTIPVSGIVNINDLNYTSKELPQGFRIESSEVALNTKRIDVKSFRGKVGNSNLVLKGYLSNYIDYFVHENAILDGKFDFTSDFVDLNEWMAGEEESEIENEDTASLEIVKIPADIDIVLNSRIEKVIYDNLELEDFKGQVVVRNGAIRLNEISFNTLGGLFIMDGMFDTKDEINPTFDFDLSIKDLSIPESYNHFVTIQMLAPIAEIMEGSFSSNFKLNGALKNNFSPDLTTLSGSGLLNITNATIQGSKSKVISGITKVSKLSGESSNVGFSNVILKSQIENGRVFTQPFNVKFGENNALIAGSSGLDGSLDYNIKIDVPPKVIQTAGSLLSSIAGKDFNVNAENVKLNLKVKGNYEDPKISILGIETGESERAAQDALEAAVEAEKEKAIEEAEKMLEAEKEKAPEEVQKLLEEHEDEIEIAKDRLKKFFKKEESKKKDEQ
jgi:hypothetical protein